MKTKNILSYLVCFLLATISISVHAKHPENDSPYVIIVEWDVAPENMGKLLDLLTKMQTETLENESGCFVYDILQSEVNPTKIFIYEMYENETAFKKHINSGYFKEIVPKEIKPLIKAEKITKVILMNRHAEGDAKV